MKTPSDVKVDFTLRSSYTYFEAIFDLNIGNDSIGIISNLFLLCGRVFTIISLRKGPHRKIKEQEERALRLKPRNGM